MVPRRSATTHTEHLDDEACVYEWTRAEVHALNPTAARIWTLCDGVRTDAEIAEQLRRESHVSHAQDIVRLALAEFSHRHLLAGAVAVSSPSRRALLMRLGQAAVLLPVVTSIVAPTPLQAQSSLPQSATFNFTGALQTFVVPSGVTRVGITAFGAQGGPAVNSGDLGLGGSVIATIPVKAGTTLNIFVGGQGGLGTSGFNGGAGGSGVDSTWDASHGPGGGGGATSTGTGGSGGLYGGGGGGGGWSGGLGGNGAPGIIVITYTPTAATARQHAVTVNTG